MEIFLKLPSPFWVTNTVYILFHYPFSFFSFLIWPPVTLLSVRSLNSPIKHKAIEDCSWSPSCPTLARDKKKEREFDWIELLLEAAKGRLYRLAWEEVAYLYEYIPIQGVVGLCRDTSRYPFTLSNRITVIPYTLPHFQPLSPDYSQGVLILLVIFWNDPLPLCNNHYTSPLYHNWWASQLL